jgi:hypothetical protein
MTDFQEQKKKQIKLKRQISNENQSIKADM